MSATIKTPAGEATITNYVWIAENEQLEDFLNSLLNPGGATPDDPNPDLNAAQAAIAELPFKAELVHFDEEHHKEGVIY